MIFKDGVNFPYTPDEFLTDLKFSDKTAHMMFEVEDNMTALLEERLWWIIIISLFNYNNLNNN